MTQDKERRRAVREVIDGQQRISAVLDYVQGNFALSKNVASEHQGRRFDQLPPAARDAVLSYSFICEVFSSIGDDEVLEIFRRVNTYSVPLNNQELRNGRWFGIFKEASYTLASKYLTFWRKSKIFSEQKIARMAEVELTSELLIVLIDGVQDKKKQIDTYYEKFDEAFPNRASLTTRFERVLSEIRVACPSLEETSFTRAPLFYSLFTAVAHRMYGVPGLDIPRKGKGSALTGIDRDRLDSALIRLTEVIQGADEAAMGIRPHADKVRHRGPSDRPSLV